MVVNMFGVSSWKWSRWWPSWSWSSGLMAAAEVGSLEVVELPGTGSDQIVVTQTEIALDQPPPDPPDVAKIFCIGKPLMFIQFDADAK